MPDRNLPPLAVSIDAVKNQLRAHLKAGMIDANAVDLSATDVIRIGGFNATDAPLYTADYVAVVQRAVNEWLDAGGLSGDRAQQLADAAPKLLAVVKKLLPAYRRAADIVDFTKGADPLSDEAVDAIVSAGG